MADRIHLHTVVCPDCRSNKEETIFGLQMMRHRAEKRVGAAQLVCASCCAVSAAEEIECESIDCPWLFERFKAGRELEGAGQFAEQAALGAPGEAPVASGPSEATSGGLQ